MVGEEGVEGGLEGGLVLVAVHDLEGLQQEQVTPSTFIFHPATLLLQVMSEAVSILNSEWPRSRTIRLRGLESSSRTLPSSLVMLWRGEVLGHARSGWKHSLEVRTPVQGEQDPRPDQ